MKITCGIISVVFLLTMNSVGFAQRTSDLWKADSIAPASLNAPNASGLNLNVAKALESEPVNDQRWRGVGLGALIVGGAAGTLTYLVCSNTENTSGCANTVVGAALGGALVGGIIGGLIGAAIPKQ